MGRKPERKSAFDLISVTDYQCIVQDYDAHSRGIKPMPAGLVVDQAIAFVATAAAAFNEGRWAELPHPLVPCRNIAEAWELLIKHTAVYRTLSATLGVFVDWLPCPEALPADVELTMVAIDAANYLLHPEVWNIDEPSESRAGVAAL